MIKFTRKECFDGVLIGFSSQHIADYLIGEDVTFIWVVVALVSIVSLAILDSRLEAADKKNNERNNFK